MRNAGSTPINVVVTASDGVTTRTYSVVVNRPPPDLAFNPVKPCRLLDTRAAYGAFGAFETRSYYASNSYFINQVGGNPNGCNIPSDASALALTITAVAQSVGGNVIA